MSARNEGTSSTAAETTIPEAGSTKLDDWFDCAAANASWRVRFGLGSMNWDEACIVAAAGIEATEGVVAGAG